MSQAQDEKRELEFHHPPAPRGPGAWSPEARAERSRAACCQSCRKAGIHQVAHRILQNGDGICNHCLRFGVPPAVAAPAVQASARPVMEPAETKEARPEATEMAKENCKCGRSWSHRGRCWVRRGLKQAPEKSKRARRPRVARAEHSAVRSARALPAHGNGNGTAAVPVAALDAWFATLGDEEKEAVLTGVWRELTPEQKAQIFAREVQA